MTGRFPVGKPKFPSWGLPLLALFLALLLHGLWLVIPQPQAPQRQVQTGIRLFAYPNLDTQAWSPTLFSLPSPLGFSGAIRQSSSNIIPPLKSPVVLNRAFNIDMSKVFPDPGLASEVNLSSRLPIMVYPLETTPENVPANYQWRFQVLEGEHADLELNRLPGIPPNGRVMVVKGSMSFDENGQVDSLFLDSPSSMGALRPQIIRSLRRIRRLGPKRSSHIRFRFDYAPVEDSR